MFRFRPLHNLRIRNKLLVSYSLVFILATTLGSIVIYSLVRKTIEARIESELNNSTATILNMVKTSATVSIKNRLRAMAEKNRDIINHYYREYKQGKISEDDAKARATSILLSQTVEGMSYLYCINSNGVVMVHPKKALLNVDFSDHEFVQEQKARKEGYLEYDWKNPDETKPRPKALYMTYFAPWDWIISATSYREEFNKLINVNDFRNSILSLKFGETGYSYVVDSKGYLIIHPKIQNENVFYAKDASDRYFIQEMCERKSGKILYSWNNPDEAAPRAKLVIFNYIPELDWIVASSGYLDELYAPLNTLRNVTIATVIMSLLLVLPITLRISSSITSPIQDMIHRFASGATGDFTARVDRQSKDELGQLASYFNTFMERLEEYSTNLQGEILERKQAEEALQRSEEMFSKAFRSSPNGICITSMQDSRFINVNNSLLHFTGYSLEEIVGKTPSELGIFPNTEEGYKISSSIEKQGHIRNQEIEFCTKSGEVRRGLLSAEIIELRGEPCMLTTIEDVTEWRRLEKDIMDIADRIRQKIGQDLHDDLCAHLIGIEVLSKVLSNRMREMRFEELTYAEKIRNLIMQAIEKARGLARGLCPVYLVDDGLASALKDLAVNTEKVFGISCLYNCDYPVYIHDNTIATHLFYIAQEAVQNAIKHGNAQHINIDLLSDNGRIILKIKDDGCGILEPIPTKGMGLRIMSYRAKMIHSSLDINRDAIGGTIVACSLRNPNDKVEKKI
ncbi:MAG: cache domain-containing protein [Syntrophales bacterium]